MPEERLEVLITPERVVIELEAYQATLPVEGGEVTILPNHIPYIGAIKAGEIIHTGKAVPLSGAAKNASAIDNTKGKNPPGVAPSKSQAWFSCGPT